MVLVEGCGALVTVGYGLNPAYYLSAMIGCNR